MSALRVLDSAAPPVFVVGLVLYVQGAISGSWAQYLGIVMVGIAMGWFSARLPRMPS